MTKALNLVEFADELRLSSDDKTVGFAVEILQLFDSQGYHSRISGEIEYIAIKHKLETDDMSEAIETIGCDLFEFREIKASLKRAGLWDGEVDDIAEIVNKMIAERPKPLEYDL